MPQTAHREVSIAGYCFDAAAGALQALEDAFEEDNRGAIDANAIIMIVMAAAAIEASMNVLIARAVERRFGAARGEAIVARLFWEKPARKPLIIAELMDVPAPDLKTAPFANLKTLFDARNELMHGKPRILPPTLLSPRDLEDGSIPVDLTLPWERDEIVAVCRQYLDDICEIEQVLGPANSLGAPMTIRDAVHFSGFAMTQPSAGHKW